MAQIPSYEKALEIVKKYNKDEFHILHAETVAYVMHWFAEREDPENAEYWRIVGLLHDTDFEMYPEDHCVKGAELLREEGVDEGIIRSAMSHGYGMTGVTDRPESTMEKVLFTVDELTGIIGAAALMRPSKSVSDMELKSVKKKFKDKAFARGCDRDVIRQGAEMLGWDLDVIMQDTLTAMQEMEKKR